MWFEDFVLETTLLFKCTLKGMSRQLIQKIKAMLLCIVYAMLFYVLCMLCCLLTLSTQRSKHAMHWIVYAMLFVDTVYTKTLVFVALTYSTYISVHNFLNIQQIFNPKKVLESSKSGLFNCINSVDIASTFWLITFLIFNRFSIHLKFWKAQNQGFSTVLTVLTCIALNILYFV